MAGAGVPVPMDDGLAMRGCGRLGTPHRKALSDRAAVYYNSRVRSWGLGRLQEMLRNADYSKWRPARSSAARSLMAPARAQHSLSTPRLVRIRLPPSSHVQNTSHSTSSYKPANREPRYRDTAIQRYSDTAIHPSFPSQQHYLSGTINFPVPVAFVAASHAPGTTGGVALLNHRAAQPSWPQFPPAGASAARSTGSGRRA